MTSRPDSVKKDLGFCLKKDDQVRGWDLSVEKLIDLRVKSQLVIIEIDGGEDSVFCEKVVGDRHLIEQVQLGDFFLLLKPVEQEKKLGLEGIFLPVLVELLEKRILFRFFHDHPGIELFCQEACQAGFPYPNGTLNNNITEHLA